MSDLSDPRLAQAPDDLGGDVPVAPQPAEPREPATGGVISSSSQIFAEDDPPGFVMPLRNQRERAAYERGKAEGAEALAKAERVAESLGRRLAVRYEEIEKLRAQLEQAEQYARDLQDSGALTAEARQEGIAEGRRQAAQHVAGLLGHRLVLAPGSDVDGLLAAALETARAEGLRQATEGKDRAVLLRFAREYVDPGECSFDHHGGCQAHGWLSPRPGEQCPNAEVRALLARLVGPWEPAEQPSTPTEDEIAAALREERYAAINAEQYQREILGMWPAEQPEPKEAK